MSHDQQSHVDDDESPYYPDSFSYGQWSWQLGWQLMSSVPLTRNGNPSWILPFSGYPQGTVSVQPSLLPGDLQHVVEAAGEHCTTVPVETSGPTLATCTSTPSTVDSMLSTVVAPAAVLTTSTNDSTASRPPLAGHLLWHYLHRDRTEQPWINHLVSTSP